MNAGKFLLRVLLGVGWMLMAYVTVVAIVRMGLSAAGTTFFEDMSNPWRAQFNSDLGMHLILISAWIIYRERNLLVGIILAIISLNLGSLFTFGYILVVLAQSQGQVSKLLLGKHWENGALAFRGDAN